MKTRMQPIGNVWNKFPRVVRDLALACGKQVRIEMEGKETELDKTIIEAIKDPLTHLVRNAVDHGIEPPRARGAAGKPAEGRLLAARLPRGRPGQHRDHRRRRRHRPRARSSSKALERGLITAEQAARMSERELINLIFLPGFSTAEKVTNVSGRGVGMDVVKTNIEKIGGTVDVQSRPGAGHDGQDQDPADAGDHPGPDRHQRRRPLRDPAGQPARAGAPRGRAGARRHRDDPRRAGLPPARQPAAAGLPEPRARASSAGRAPDDGASINIVVLQADDRQFGLVVDGINDTEEIVVKPLGKQLKGITAFAGATIMGDGRVALILDVLGLAQRASVISQVRDRAARPASAPRKDDKAAQRQTLLLFLTRDGRPHGDPAVDGGAARGVPAPEPGARRREPGGAVPRRRSCR